MCLSHGSLPSSADATGVTREMPRSRWRVYAHLPGLTSGLPRLRGPGRSGDAVQQPAEQAEVPRATPRQAGHEELTARRSAAAGRQQRRRRAARSPAGTQAAGRSALASVAWSPHSARIRPVASATVTTPPRLPTSCGTEAAQQPSSGEDDVTLGSVVDLRDSDRSLTEVWVDSVLLSAAMPGDRRLGPDTRDVILALHEPFPGGEHGAPPHGRRHGLKPMYIRHGGEPPWSIPNAPRPGQQRAGHCVARLPASSGCVTDRQPHPRYPCRAASRPSPDGVRETSCPGQPRTARPDDTAVCLPALVGGSGQDSRMGNAGTPCSVRPLLVISLRCGPAPALLGAANFPQSSWGTVLGMTTTIPPTTTAPAVDGFLAYALPGDHVVRRSPACRPACRDGAGP